MRVGLLSTSLAALHLWGRWGRGSAVRISTEESSIIAEGGSTSNTCPIGDLIQETDLGDCQNAATMELVPYYCCNILRVCRQEATDLLTYYSDWVKVYYQDCFMQDSDFELTSDGLGLQLLDHEKLCSTSCQLSSQLRSKPRPAMTPQELLATCSGVVVEREWKPQLDSAKWNGDKVTEMDIAWSSSCGGETGPAPSPGAPAPAEPEPETTTTTTTQWVPPDLTPIEGFVDFKFMTRDFTRVWPNRGLFAKINKMLFRRRNVKETQNIHMELVRGHTCNRVGRFDETYYASSLCYWIPENANEEEASQEPSSVGLEWQGGKERGTSALCSQVLTGAGLCAKCSVCHNNAMDPDGRVNATAFVERIDLTSFSPNCLMEGDVELVCIDRFHSSDPTLYANATTCQALKARYAKASSEYEHAKTMTETLPQLIEVELPEKIQSNVDESARQAEIKRETEKEEWEARQGAHTHCQAYNNVLGYTWWYANLLQGVATDQILASMGGFACIFPERPIDRGDGMYEYEWQVYVEKLQAFEACETCEGARDVLQRAHDKYQEAVRRQELAEKHASDLRATLAEKQQEQADWTARWPTINSTRAELVKDWEPKAEACEEQIYQYTKERPRYVRDCAPSLYSQSCESACLGVQEHRQEGCGIIEGSRPTDAVWRGGVRSTCKPPHPSWVNAPWTYGAPMESKAKQCERIVKAQRPLYSQRVLKMGWMKKKGRYFGWKNRYFVLESGDEVRSGMLYYYTNDPAVDATAQERFRKKIILWDAQGTETYSGGVLSNAECIKLSHFYRNYELCVVGQGAAQNEKDRNEWLFYIQSEIKGVSVPR